MWGVVYFVAPPLYTGARGAQSVLFEVQPGHSLQHIARTLTQQGLISSPRLFVFWARALGFATQLKAGEYELHSQMSPQRVLEILSSGRSVEHSITFHEGLNMHQMGQMLEQRGLGKREDFLSLCKDPELIRRLVGEDLPSLEGYLFPETYKLSKRARLEGLIETMFENFSSAWRKAQRPQKASSRGFRDLGGVSLTRHQVVVLASMVEKETGAPEERPRIASVFFNRLKKRMRLASDPTIIYGVLAQSGIMLKNIKKKHILQKTPYNTYKIPSLPKGPIANPGLEALRAVLYPEQSEFLFFVSKNNGTHHFSKSYKEHKRYVDKYQRRRRK